MSWSGMIKHEVPSQRAGEKIMAIMEREIPGTTARQDERVVVQMSGRWLLVIHTTNVASLLWDLEKHGFMDLGDIL